MFEKLIFLRYKIYSSVQHFPGRDFVQEIILPGKNPVCISWTEDKDKDKDKDKGQGNYSSTILSLASQVALW